MQPHLLVHRKPAAHGATTEEEHAVVAMRAPGARPDADFDACCCCAADVAMPSGDSICIVTQHPIAKSARAGMSSMLCPDPSILCAAGVMLARWVP